MITPEYIEAMARDTHNHLVVADVVEQLLWGQQSEHYRQTFRDALSTTIGAYLPDATIPTGERQS